MDFTFGDSLLTAVVGMLVVFLVLIILMICIVITSKIIGNGKKKEKVAVANSAPVPAAAAPAFSVPLANGSTGDIKTFDVPDRTAAMVMSIVADEMNEPLNTLRFKSIKEMDNKK